MAATHHTPEAVEFGEHLTALRVAAGGPSYGVMSRTILVNAGITVSDQTLGNYHDGKTDPRRVAPHLLKAIQRFYGCESADLGAVAAAELASLADLMASDLPFSRSGWLERMADNRRVLARTG